MSSSNYPAGRKTSFSCRSLRRSLLRQISNVNRLRVHRAFCQDHNQHNCYPNRCTINYTRHHICKLPQKHGTSAGQHVIRKKGTASSDLPTALQGRQTKANARYSQGKHHGCEPLRKQRQPNTSSPAATAERASRSDKKRERST